MVDPRWIWLSALKMDTSRKLRLLRHFKSIDMLYSASREDYMASGIVRESSLGCLGDKSLDSSERIIEKCMAAGIRAISAGDREYPQRLANIDDPPVVLYYKGTLPSFDEEPAVAIVGSRNNTVYGQITAERLAYEMSASGAHIISGMAKGIDAAAHRGALLAGKTTTAVLGCGPDIVYPKANRHIYEEICARGCILSEYPPGTPPLQHHFPERNRIVSGLSVGVVVVEAGLKSGALITARIAADQGRDVFAVPGNVDVPESAGANSLIQGGAKLVMQGWDVLSEFEGLFPDKLRPVTGEKAGDSGNKGIAADPPADFGGGGTDKNKKSLEYLRKDFTDLQMKIILSLAKRPMYLDQIIEECGLTAAQALSELTVLEIEGAVAQLPGKRFSVSYTI